MLGFSDAFVILAGDSCVAIFQADRYVAQVWYNELALRAFYVDDI
jgi:hypothetical protein